MNVGVNVRRHPEGGVLTGQTHTDLKLQQPGTKTWENSRAVLSTSLWQRHGMAR